MDTPGDLRERFHCLAAEWKEQSRYLSNSAQMAVLRPYQRIIGMGPPVVPLILEELRREPDQWFWALEAITGANPVRPEDARKVRAMTRAWVEWGERQGYSHRSAQAQDFPDPEAIPISPGLNTILDRSHRQICEGAGLGHEEFWVEVEGPEAPMIADDRELQVTQDRIGQLHAQVAHLRQTEANPANYRAAASGFLTEIDRMQLEVREYLSLHPKELAATA